MMVFDCFYMPLRMETDRCLRHFPIYHMALLLLVAGCLACSGPRQTTPVPEIVPQDTDVTDHGESGSAESDPEDSDPVYTDPEDANPDGIAGMETVESVELPVPEPAAPLPTIAFAIQAGAFSTAERASAYAVQLQQQGLDTYYVIDGDDLYKVRFGRFDTRDAAFSEGNRLKAEGVVTSFLVVRPLPDQHQPPPAEVLRGSLVKTARRFLGTPYRWGSASPEKGFDCSGLTMTVYRLNGMDLPRTARAQFRSGAPVEKMQVRDGDLLFFDINRDGRADHVGLYCGDSRFIHAPGRGKKVRTASLANRYFVRRYIGARRYF